MDGRIKPESVIGMGQKLIEIADGSSSEAAIQQLSAASGVEYAEPNYIYNMASTTPNDPSFSSLWGLHNTGLSGGTADIDMNAPEAWDITTGDSAVVVGVIDTGVDYTHSDLDDNAWINLAEIPGNGIDDDSNGYIDDVHGINAITGSGDPMEDHYHGTHVAGTIGAEGNNSVGVVGVNWNVQIAGCKFLDSGGSGSSSDAIDCLDYFVALKTAGVNLIATNNSWGGGGFSQSLKDAISAQEAAGILFIASAGNDGVDNDADPHYPSNYVNSNIISVAAIDDDGNLASFSEWGLNSVDVAAPGVSITSTFPGGSYGTISGTSMATPHVAGLAALIKANDPSADWMDIKNLILASGQPNPALEGLILSELKPDLSCIRHRLQAGLIFG